ncbi:MULTISPECIES: gliding motility protein [Persicobacter]|uniref:Gliding motility lipoprotein GldD n=1 Tax=Persicobacter diffluens TaxID=981 RepID=A0AAN4VT14_9BACT|nr:gliding motility protein [Persicobacter sp. CCB-QB2]GJM59594.1 gliding motility lipoprotein GldD [Persicobacter diffluens]
MKLRYYFFSICLLIGAQACNDQSYYPKPTALYRIPLPEHAYISAPDSMPYDFEMSKYAVIKPDTSWIAEEHWIHVFYPEFVADIQLTYKAIDSQEKLEEFVNESYRLTHKQQIKATAIDEGTFTSANGHLVSVAAIEGEVPTQFQFFTTDSSKHFLRGALYFRTATANDSLAPVIQYVTDDIFHMMNTLEWK